MLLIMTYDENDKSYEVAIEVLFEENYERVYRTAASILTDSELAKDATQETLVRAFLKMGTLKDKSKFGSWVCTVAVNICNRMLRQKIIYRSNNMSIFDEEGSIRDYIPELTDYNVPDKIYEDMELRQELKRCIGELDPLTQQMVNLRFYSELSIEEIAVCMDVKEGTVKSRIHRAKKKIAEKLMELSDLRGMKSNG